MVHSIRILALVGIAALGASTHVQAQPTLDEVRALAEQGDAAAQYTLGYAYASGQDTPQDYTEALRWWRLAAAQDHAFAQYSLGALYDNGLAARGESRSY